MSKINKAAMISKGRAERKERRNGEGGERQLLLSWRISRISYRKAADDGMFAWRERRLAAGGMLGGRRRRRGMHCGYRLWHN